MSIDLSQFFEVFFEESFEGLDTMEAELLNLVPGEEDLETINTIFRAAHSIKGGSGTFGFSSVSDFTHVLETLLDQIRQGERTLTTEHVNLLLKAVDCLRSLLAGLQAEQAPDLTEADTLRAQFEEVLGIKGATQESTTQPSDNQPDSDTYQIDFKPHHHLFKTGNEPLIMISELEQLGELDTTVFYDEVPEITDLSSDECFLHWRFFLNTSHGKSAIKEVFEWVEDDADITIELCGGLFTDDIPASATNIIDSNAVGNDAAPTLEPLTPEPITEPTKQAKPIKPTSASANKKSTTPESTSIRVGIDKVDSLINMVGELVITQAMLNQLSEQDITPATITALQEGLAQLAHNTRDLQENVMRIRMLPINFVFSRFPRLVRDIAQKLNKQVELKLIGEQTELDKTVMEKISDPMVHLVRNSLDHGLETVEKRLQAGKDPVGTVTLNAFHQGGNIVIEIMDDGQGLNTKKIQEKAIANELISADNHLSDEEINELIFMPGFSTMDEVSDLSGRGVGMDVVKRNIQSLNGSVEVTSAPGVGSTFTIRLPLTLAILDGQLVKVAQHTYIIPLISIVESLQIDIAKVSRVGKNLDVLRLRDEYIPILRLYDIFNHDNAIESLDKTLLVVVETDNQKVGLLVDDLLSQQQVVIKSLEANYQKVDGISGATILGDGRVSLIVDISGLIKLSGLKKPGSQELSIESQAALEAL
ncbi:MULTISPECIES: chemotaxis protein CheA [unclassified Pseudoalteromonas]|uniref:chemotaxis protein CheA n=1 Tax=unclassified Pseudoalteromonas TaxID=194690 RepID=UPI0007301FAB|nr:MULTISPECIES: chemotaxis protein CheA [unclassified Pseudoalteromonas]KTD98637.1 chemotaxis protein CheA [Pseudoalteromonas sp. H71]TMN80938.1 chemotaxis protein CheA [Pseudoalteromonas sp. S410]TMN87771.1 chemotaxis protein CheA [Pseudoalteromonas sp. S408]TMN94817.1 chemotaxis protein CheA [Pseudoalteromonas sp. S407]TMO02482.1 chemotaxis protein CheA [Pseudoalteromonas sp. S409]